MSQILVIGIRGKHFEVGDQNPTPDLSSDSSGLCDFGGPIFLPVDLSCTNSRIQVVKASELSQTSMSLRLKYFLL